MANATKRKLSGSTDGKGILVAATASAGTTIHTAVAGQTAGTFDEVHLWAVNDDTSVRTLTIEYGGTTDPDNVIVVALEAQAGAVYVVPGLILQNSLVIRAFCDSANKVIIYGFVNAITD